MRHAWEQDSATVQQDSATGPPIFMQLTGQNNGGIASSAFLLA